MKRRETAIGLLSNLYPVFVISHLMFGDWCKRCQLIFNVVPIVVFGGLFCLWANTSDVKLTYTELISIRYLTLMIVIIYCYYNICAISSSPWVYSHNLQFSTFIAITGLYYLYELKLKHARR